MSRVESRTRYNDFSETYFTSNLVIANTKQRRLNITIYEQQHDLHRTRSKTLWFLHE